MRKRVARPASAAALFLLAGSCAGGGAGPGGSAATDAPVCSAATAAAPVPASCGLVCRAELPVTYSGQDPIVAVWVNQRPTRMIFDTGSAGTAMTRAAAASLGLPGGQPTGGTISGIGGQQPLRLTTIRHLAVSFIEQDDVPAAVIQMGDARDPAPADGILGNNILRAYDIDLDLPHYRIRLYQGRACTDTPPGWTAPDGALPFDPDRRGHHVVVAAAIAGQPVRVLIDTGAGQSALTRAAALRVGVPRAQLADNLGARMSGVGTEHVPGTFNELPSFDIAGEHMAPFQAAVFDPAMPSSDMIWDMLLGEDYLQQHKVWISYTTGKVSFAHTW